MAASSPSKTPVPSGAAVAEAAADGPLTAKALVLLVLKEGVHGAARLLARAAVLAARAIKDLLQWAVDHRASLARPLLELPALLQRLLSSMWASRAGKGVVALLASVACLQLHWRSGRGGNGSAAGGGAAHAQLSSSLSLLFGLIRCAR